MAPVIRIDDDVMKELKRRAVELDMVFSSVNDVLKKVLEIDNDNGSSQRNPTEQNVPHNTNATYPSSTNHHVQKLIDGIRPVIFSLSQDGLRFYPTSGIWLAKPNFVAIRVQDSRASNLRIIIYGHPSDFEGIGNNLDIKADRNSYSRFTLNTEGQIKSALDVIRHAHALHVQRNRRYSG